MTPAPPRLSPAADSREPTFLDALKESWYAARRNLVPGVALWIAGVLLLLTYLFVPAVHHGLDHLAQAKESWGLVYPAVSTAIFAGVIPWCVMRFRHATRRLRDRARLVFLLAFWTERGIEVDLLYRLQAKLFGHGHDPLTLTIKTAVDQLVYVPLWIVPTTVVAYLWFDVGCSLRRTRAAFVGHWYRRLMLPVLVANLVVWIPAVVIIYILPLPLQLPIQNLVVCLWSLMLIFLMREEADDKQAIAIAAPS